MNLFKQAVETLPVSSETPIEVDAGGRRFAVVMSDGRRRRLPIKKNRRTGAEYVVTRESREWHGKIRLGPKTWRRVRLFTDKTASQRRLAEMQREADQDNVGVLALIRHADTPIADHLAAYLASMRAAGHSPDNIAIADSVLKRAIGVTGWRFARDITLESAETLVNGLLKRDGSLASAGYRNSFTKRLKAFSAWLTDQHRIPKHPLLKLRRTSTRRTQNKRDRRAASAGQLVDLLSLTLPMSRQLSYALAGLNGLRRNEIKTLTWDRVHLAAPIPFIELEQKQADDQKRDSIPIHPYCLRLLKKLTQGMPGVRVVRPIPDVATLEKDWRRVGVEMTDPTTGRRIDFHGLRHTFTSLLDMAGVSRATKKRLTRHAAEDVTDGYAHADLAESAAALSRLNSPLNPPATAQAAIMTGTLSIPSAHQNQQGASRTTGRTKSSFRVCHTESPCGTTIDQIWIDHKPDQTALDTSKPANSGDVWHYLSPSGLKLSTTLDNVAIVRPDARVGQGESDKPSANHGIFEMPDHR